jgi:transposase
MHITEDDIRSANLDHHGLVAAVCQDLGIKEKINAALGPGDRQRVVSAGTSVVAMILNGLGFTNRRLYLTPQFFANKPVERLLGEALEANDLTDHTLGQTLDEIAAYGTSRLFGEVAFAVALEQDLLGRNHHLDTTSLSVYGVYEGSEGVEAIELTHGYSKDHRPDLKQAVLSLVVNGPAAMPLWMEALDGNSSDKTSFHETISRVRAFQKQVAVDRPCRWIADSALYSQDKLLAQTDTLWVCRVPETLKEAKTLVQTPCEALDWVVHEDGYCTSAQTSSYGGIEQRWLLVYSEQAYRREQATFEKKLTRQRAQLDKQLWHLRNETFACAADARKALTTLAKRYRYFSLGLEVEALERYLDKGRPQLGAQKVVVGYRLVGKARPR